MRLVAYQHSVSKCV